MHFDYVSGRGIAKNAPILDSGELKALLWKKCSLSIDGEREQSLAPEKQMMRLRMLAPLIAVNSAQASTCSVAVVILNFRSSCGLRRHPFASFPTNSILTSAELHL